MKIIALPTNTDKMSQQGAVLLVSLIFLLLLTILGVSAMDRTILETKMASNNQERNFALRVAEIGLLQGDKVVFSEKLSTEDKDIDEVLNIDRGNGLFAETTNSKIIYLGRYSSPRGSDASGISVLRDIFEIQSSGKSSSGDDHNPVTTTLHVGVKVPVFYGQGSNSEMFE